MEILKPIFAAIALIGLHITHPFHCILMNKDTTYSDLLHSFAQLYKDLTEIDAKEFLTMDQVCKFPSHEAFFESLPKEEFLTESQRQSITMYSQEIEKLNRLVLLTFAEGFALQKGSQFCFGPHADDDNTKVLQIHKANSEILENLDKNV